jgi:putative DNA methylase
MKVKKKLIEVALPLEAINKASAREKSIRHGHPSTLHLWWARRPLAAARAVIFSQMVDDPIWQTWRYTCAENADHPRAKELFDRHKLPAFQDPFAGGGALPLEAQRLGLESYASDLNPVAVLINKAMIEIPPKFAGKPPVNPEWQTKSSHEKAANPWRGAQGLAEDVRYYGKWMRDEAEKRIGHLYPKMDVTAEMAEERPGPEEARGPTPNRDRLDLGAHSEEPEPGLRAGGRTACLHFHAFHQGRQGSLHRAGD